MQPITREIIDRRQPAIRWSAVFAGAAVACGIWILLQVFGIGAGLAAIGTDHAGRVRSAGIGTTVWSLLAPLLAMYIGGWIAGNLAGTRDGRLGALHGAVVWAITSALGLFIVVSFISALVATTVQTNGASVEATGPAAAGRALLAAGGSMLLSLGTALLGGKLAVRGIRRRDRVELTTVQPPVVPPPAVDTIAD